ncbi:MAG: hypothetical protein ACREF1_00025 [Acetobacteraceae bacterium]
MPRSILFAAFVALAASPLAGRSTAAAPAPMMLGQAPQVTLVAGGCGRHYHWVGRYRRHGRWVRGRCVPNR